MLLEKQNFILDANFILLRIYFYKIINFKKD